MIAVEYEKGWQGRITQDHGIRLARVLRGVEEIRTLDGAVLRSGDIGLAQGYIAGDWSTPHLADLLRLLIANRNTLETLVYGSW